MFLLLKTNLISNFPVLSHVSKAVRNSFLIVIYPVKNLPLMGSYLLMEILFFSILAISASLSTKIIDLWVMLQLFWHQPRDLNQRGCSNYVSSAHCASIPHHQFASHLYFAYWLHLGPHSPGGASVGRLGNNRTAKLPSCFFGTQLLSFYQVYSWSMVPQLGYIFFMRASLSFCRKRLRWKSRGTLSWSS